MRPRKSSVRRKVLAAIAGYLLVSSAVVVSAQEGLPPKPPARFFNRFSIELSGNGKWNFTGEGFAMENFRLWTTLSIMRHLNFITLTESSVEKDAEWDDWEARENRLAQCYLHYYRTFSLLPYGFTLDAKAGKLEWYPNFSDMQFIVENIDLYEEPPSMYGASLRLTIPLNKKESLYAHFGGYSGDLSADKIEPELKDAYLRVTPELFKDVGLKAQIGQSEGTKHLVKEAYLSYAPTFFGNLTLDTRIGKLAGRDETPYGIHLGISRKFKYIELGGYYERRLEQDPDTEHILGFYWTILAPEPLVKFINEFHIMYDTNSDTLHFTIPFLRVSTER